MKKLLSILITLCFLLTSIAVFAEAETAAADTLTAVITTAAASTDTDEDTKDVKAPKSEKQALKAQKISAKQVVKADKEKAKAERKILKDQITANRETIKGLKVQVRELHKKAVARIKEIIKDKENITQETVDELKDMLATIREDRSEFGQSFGKIREEGLDIALAKKNQEPEKIQQSLSNVLDVQKARIDSLKALIEDLQKIADYKAE
ncbi:MAG: hypothetical protein ACM3UU_09200 [Ignavibacteriales bacterium]